MSIVKTRKPIQVPVSVLLQGVGCTVEGTRGRGQSAVLQEEIKMTWKKRNGGWQVASGGEW